MHMLFALALLAPQVTPGASWTSKAPSEVGMDSAKLGALSSYTGGRGFVSRHGYQVYTWGDPAARGDIASAAKPLYAHFLFKAVEEGKLANVDVKANAYETRLNSINAALGNKDKNITFRHFANQVSVYGLTENPGSAYAYNDWQMALFWDTLFQKVYGATYSNVDANVLKPKLTDLLKCQDSPTFMAFGTGDRPGRVGISPRDHARFGLLYLREGDWGGTRLLSAANARTAVTSPLPNSIPRTAGQAAEMIAGQRSIGSTTVPDDQTDHLGSYSWLWWTNGVDRTGKRLLPDAPLDAFMSSGHGGKRALVVVPSLDLVCAWNDTTITDWTKKNEAVKRLVQSVTAAGPMPGQIVADPANPRWLRRSGGGPFFLCGPGDPEGFLYRGTRNGDGTRSGDQMSLINKTKGTGANCIYMIAVRSHGGDGGPTENPFVGSDPAQGLDEDILQQWETWFAEMDRNGIVIYFFFYDDSARIWNTGDAVGAAERTFLQTIVNRFEHHKNLIWCVAEEYSEAYSAARVKAIAAEIRAADDHDHPIAVHKLGGLTFSEFADDPAIDQFAIQYNVATPAELHAGMVTAWNNAAGKYSLNMSEAANHGTGATARKKDWASALGGAYAMRLGMDIAGTAVSDLQDCGRLVSFMESTDFDRMAPHDELKFGGTEYVLALPGDSYIAYASALSGAIGLRSMAAGTYSFRWFDCATGTAVQQSNVSVAAGDRSWAKPSGIGNELAVWVKKSGGGGNVAPTANNQSVTVPHNTATSITLSYSDPDGPGPFSFTIVQAPTKGTLSGSGGTRTYTPQSGASGADSFTWKVNDGLADSNTATVSITVQPAGNAAPVANDQSFTTTEGTAVTMSLSYTDPDGPGPYAVTIVTPPSNGTLTGANNDRTYTPNAGFVGTDSFTWRVSDGQATSNTATVTINVQAGGIVSNTSPAGYLWDVLDVGKVQYVDRTYTFSAVPASTVGLLYLRTANDDKNSTGTSFVAFDVSAPVTVYVAHDDRITAKPSWLGTYTDTGENVVSGGGTFSLWAKDFAAGRVVLGGNIASGTTSASMYTVVVRPQGSGTGFAVTVDSVSTGRPYSLSTAKAGALYYVDRSYTIAALGAALDGAVLLRTANDDKNVPAAVHLRFTVTGPAALYVCYDKRATKNPSWLNDGTWTLTGDLMRVSDGGASPMRVFSKSVGAGQVTLGGNQAGGPTGAGSNYVVVIRSTGASSASFKSVAPDVWEHPGDADGDGLADAFEATVFTDPTLADTDGDGDPDENEIGPDGRTLWETQEASAGGSGGGGGGGGGGGCGATGLELLLLLLLRRR